MSYSPIDDEKKPFTMAEFVKELKDAADQYEADLADANEFTRAPHTFDEWMIAFGGYMSW